jgi:glutamine synthetase
LLFLGAFISALDQYADLLRLSAASAGNDCRLGACEAPPAIISMFLGAQLTHLLDPIANGHAHDAFQLQTMETGVNALPDVQRTIPTATAPRPLPLPDYQVRDSGWSAPRSRSPFRTLCSTPPSRMCSGLL